MYEQTVRRLQRGDERLMRTCSIVEQLCTDRVPAAMRLQSVIGREDVQELVVPLARRLIERTSPVCQEHAGHCIAAA